MPSARDFVQVQAASATSLSGTHFVISQTLSIHSASEASWYSADRILKDKIVDLIYVVSGTLYAASFMHACLSCDDRPPDRPTDQPSFIQGTSSISF